MTRPFEHMAVDARQRIQKYGTAKATTKDFMLLLVDGQHAAQENQLETLAKLDHLHECIEARLPMPKRRRVALIGGGTAGTGGLAWVLWEFVRPLLTG